MSLQHVINIDVINELLYILFSNGLCNLCSCHSTAAEHGLQTQSVCNLREGTGEGT